MLFNSEEKVYIFFTYPLFLSKKKTFLFLSKSNAIVLIISIQVIKQNN